MVLDASSKVAVKCSDCGKYNIADINIFALKAKTSCTCSCGHKILKMWIDKDDIFFEINCIACDKKHRYKFKLKEIIEKPLNIISCPDTGMEIAFVGRENYVDDVVKRYMDDLYELLKELGAVEEPEKLVK
jgi:DNA-directed RNA polymerase subunit RPC12/RpoP